MDRLRVAILIAQAKVERETMRRIAFAIVERRIVRKRLARREKEEEPMAGEIRKKMEELRAARTRMVADISAEIDSVTVEVHATRADGLEAAKLPRAELELTKKEIRDIRAEFAPTTNGPPPGPLQDAPPPSPAPSPGSQVALDPQLPKEPSASWGANK
jgi:hypothetical protein